MADTPPRWYNSNPLIAIATLAIAALSIGIASLTNKVQTPHLFIALFLVISIISAAACIIAGYKFERLYQQFTSFLAGQKTLDELKLRVDEVKRQLANVEWLRLKKEFQDFEISDQTDEVWVLTFDFRYELYDFKDIVISNLQKGKRYTYIYPSDARNRVYHLKGILDEAGIAEEVVNEKIDFYELDKRIVPLNEAIYNPNPKAGKKMRAIIMTPEFEFEYYIELNPEQTSRMIDKFRSLMSDAKKMNLSQILSL